MDDYRAAEIFADHLMVTGNVTIRKFEHFHRVKDMISDFGGTNRDQAAALLHEVSNITEDSGLRQEFIDHLQELQSCLPDFLSDGNDQLRIKLDRLKSAHLGMKIIWLCDMIDSFENNLILLPDPEEMLHSKIEERAREARSALSIVDPARTSSLLNRARRAIEGLSMRSSAGLI